MRTWLSVLPSHPKGIAILYALVGVVWIFTSDLAIHYAIEDATVLHRAHLLAEGIFILATAGLLYYLVGWTQRALRRRKRRLEQRNKELERSQTHLETAQQIARLGSWERDMQTGELYWSDETYRLLGWDPDESLSYDRFMEAVHPEDREAHRTAQEEAFATDGTLDHTYRIVRPDGEVRVLHERGQATYATDGDLLRVAGTVADITERVETERQLRETKTHLQMVLDTAGYVFMLLAPDGTVLLANETAKEQADRVFDQSLQKGVSVWDFVIPGMEEQFEVNFARALDGEVVESEAYVPESAGGPQWFEVKYIPIEREGEVTAVLHSAEEITAVRQAQQARKESEERYRTLFNSVRDEILVCEVTDDGFTIIEVNDAACDVLGYSRDELIGAPVQKVSQSSAEERAEWKKRLREEGDVLLESTHYAKDGTPIDVEIKSKLFELNGDEVTLSIARDIRERKRMEQALRASREEYRHLFESNPLPMWTYDLDTYEVVRVNDAAVDKYGYSEDEFQSMTIFDLRPESEHERLRANLQQPRETMETSGPWIHETKEGRQIEVEAHSHVLDRQERNTVLLLANDVTERNRAMRENEQFNRELQTLLSVSQQMRQRFDSSDLFQEIVSGIVETLPNAEAASLWLLDEEGDSVYPAAWCCHDDDVMENLRLEPDESIVGMMLQREASVLIPDVQQEEAFEKVPEQVSTSLDRLRAIVGTPLLVEGESLGALFADSFQPDAFVERETQLLESLAGQAGLALQNAKLIDRLRALSRRLIGAQEQERRRVARELHDEMGGLLSSLQMCLDMASAQAESEGELLDELEEAMELTDALNRGVRRLALRLRPSVLDDLGLTPALQSLVKRRMPSALDVELYSDLEGGERVNAEVETAAYRIAQEALTNAARHAEAESVQIIVNKVEAAQLEVHIIDDGVGFDPDVDREKGQQMGISSMRERAELLGGSLTIDAAPGRGTRITAVLPLERKAAPSVR